MRGEVRAEALVDCIRAVSYTHLDVYKRQHIDISLCIFYHFKNRLARGENSFLSPFLDKDRGLQ